MWSWLGRTNLVFRGQFSDSLRFRNACTGFFSLPLIIFLVVTGCVCFLLKTLGSRCLLEGGMDEWENGEEVSVRSSMAKACHLVHNLRPVIHETLYTIPSAPNRPVAALKDTVFLAERRVVLRAVNKIEALISRNNTVFLAERMILKQKEFRENGRPVTVDIGFHYTDSNNMNRIRAYGLLGHRERKARNIKPQHTSGAVYGEGIYTCDNPRLYTGYGDTGLIVARLAGRKMSAAMADNCYAYGNNSILVSQQSILILKESSQCLVLAHYDASLVNSCKGLAMIKNLVFNLQATLDKHFNTEPITLNTPLETRKSFKLSPLYRFFTRESKMLHYTAPYTLLCADPGSLYTVIDMEKSASAGACPICLESPKENTPVVRLRKCNHRMHLACAEQYLQRFVTCPTCQTRLEEPRGQMPSGFLSIRFDNHLHCRGSAWFHGTIVMTYNVSSGRQKCYHPNPGKYHGSASRVAYVPDCWKGRMLLVRLEYAFSRGLTFTVGTYLTTGKRNQVTWSSIHHKTSTDGGAHGFPDPHFFDNCNAELDALGVPCAWDLLMAA
jgi:hypothetical protein